MYLNSLFPLYFLTICSCPVALWQPAVFYSVLILHLRTHSIHKRKNFKEFQQSFWGLLFVLLSVLCLVTIHGANYNKNNTVKRNCVFFSVRIIVYILCWNMLTFPLFFQSCSSLLFQSSFQKAFQTLFKVLLPTWKTVLRLSNSQQ